LKLLAANQDQASVDLENCISDLQNRA